MNKRFKELADQLGPIATIGNWGRVEWAINVYPQIGDQLYAAIDLQKFAELIVRECMTVVSRKCASPTAYNALVEHFGGEEALAEQPVHSKPWVGLTDGEMHQLNDALNLQGRFPIIQAIEAKLKDKNT